MIRYWAVVALGWLVVLVGAAGLALHWTTWTQRWIVLLASFAPYVTGAAVVGAVLLAVLRRWLDVAVAGIVIGCATWTFVPQFVADGATGDGARLTIMQANILFGGGDADAVVGAIDEHGVDIVTIDELTSEGLGNLEAAGIGDRLPYRFVRPAPGAKGTGIWSGYPLADPTRYDGFVLEQLSARVTLPDATTVKVFAFHPVPPYPDGPDRWADEMGRIGGILGAETSGTVIVGGDFNATLDHALFRDLVAHRFTDAADDAGAGMLRTYPADRWWPAVIGIDHVLVADAAAADVRTVDIPDSDHKAVVATVVIPR